jgi:hypothetical protein
VAIEEPLLTYRQAARIFGVRVDTIGDLAPRLGIPSRIHPANGRGKGLTRADMAKLRKVLGPKPEPATT